MEGTVVNYRLGRHHQTPNQLVIKIESVDNKEKAAKLVGKTVKWNTGKKNLMGKITSAHGNKGAVRALFETGVPGQAIGTKVKVE